MIAWRRPQVILLLIASLLLAATFTKPVMQLQQATYRYVFVFDISQSMNVKDIPNTNSTISRLDFAKQLAIKSVSEFPCGTEIGLAIFTGHRAFLLITPVETCANELELSSIVNNIDWRMTWEPRSEIAKGLYRSIRLMKQLDAKTRLVFLTDGHEAPPINIGLQPRFTGQKSEIKGLIAGIGGIKPVAIPKYDKSGKQQGYWKANQVEHVDVYTQAAIDAEHSTAVTGGTEHLSSLRKTYLQDLANKTGLSYSQPETAEEFSQRMMSKSLSIPKVITTDIRWLLALVSLLAFIASMLTASAFTFSTKHG